MINRALINKNRKKETKASYLKISINLFNLLTSSQTDKRGHK